jgi:imidazolonepropionase
MGEAGICDRIWRDARLVTCVPGQPGVIERGVVAARDGRILYAGEASLAPPLRAAETVDCGGRLVTPGLIDAHTHLVHAGDRSGEAARRLRGESYAAIAAAGGGILSTVRATRAADQAALVASALPRLDALLAEGVTTVEIKSGYGLALEPERRMLRAARTLGERRRVRVRTSFLGAHAVPPEHAGHADAYVDEIVGAMLPALAAEGLVDAVDAFCERIAFSPAQVARVFEAARALGLPVKLHADQLSDGGGGALAARHGALSADHLEHLGEDGIAAMAGAGTVAVLLPGAFYFLRETVAPPVAALRRAGVPMAVATDCNPGTSPLTSLLLAMNLAAVLFGLTPEECLAGVTREAARALGLARETGMLAPGLACDLAIWDVTSVEALVCRMGPNPLQARVLGGE